MAISKYQAQLNKQRDERIAKKYLAGASQISIAEETGMTYANVHRIIGKMGWKQGIAEKFGESMETARTGNLIPLADEADLLKSGLAAAENKIDRYYIRAAFKLDEDALDGMKDKDVLRRVVQLNPLVYKRRRSTAPPRSVNFFAMESTAEELERRLLEYAMNSAIRPQDEK